MASSIVNQPTSDIKAKQRQALFYQQNETRMLVNSICQIQTLLYRIKNDSKMRTALSPNAFYNLATAIEYAERARKIVMPFSSK